MMTEPPPHPGLHEILRAHPFAARTLSLSHIGGTRSNAEQRAWWRGFLAGTLTVVFGSLGVMALLLALI